MSNDNTLSGFWDYLFPIFLMFALGTSLGAIGGFYLPWMYIISFIFIVYVLFFVKSQIDS
jgi:hypothetical protein|uniref:Uncharacterized protein n=1 Tax=viral metagenome TaxID=1070528 RepID=A0A6C0BJI6_9ZZZZ